MRYIYLLTLFLAIAVVVSSPQLRAANNVKVPLVQYYNTGDCSNADMAVFAEANPDLVVGFVNVHLEEDGSLLIVVHLKNGKPNTVYDFNMKCMGTFEDKLVTNSKGVGNAIYTLPSGHFGSYPGSLVFAFDMMPTGVYSPP